jgi:hypothetical protein
MISNFLGVDITPPNDIITESELFFLYGLISSINPYNIVELGGGREGICSKLFIKAQENNFNSKLFSIDVLEMQKKSENHFLLQKDINDVTPSDLHNEKIDVVFFDCHSAVPQLNFYNKMIKENLIHDDTILILHDTNLFYEPTTSKFINHLGEYGMHTKEGFAHQWVERNLVNYFKLKGYDIFNLSTKPENHNQKHQLLYGISVCKKFKLLNPIYLDYPE